jgi:hypothetical protein
MEVGKVWTGFMKLKMGTSGDLLRKYGILIFMNIRLHLSGTETQTGALTNIMI